MDESSTVQNRRQRRSNVLLTASVEANGRTLDVKLRNLSAEGALVEAAGLPIEGSHVRFRKGELQVQGKVVWVNGNRAGLQFDEPLSPEALLRHVPVPRPRVLPSFRRPGIAPQPLSRAEKALESVWGVPQIAPPRGD
ncbi:PilZ domain-containing protein [Sphingomonas humi]|uniref:PilZ domain-containing protein n=1 Tax=Sphingomonas humi TaxID=335630 RepID=A0ABP7RWF8_9SPHN